MSNNKITIYTKSFQTLLVVTFLLLPETSFSQQLGVKTDLVSDAFLSPNLGVEFSLSNRFTLETSVRYNPFKQENTHNKLHWFVRPELRWWASSKFSGHFLGIYTSYGVYNVAGMNQPLGPKEYRYEGEAYGAGISYGYQWKLARRWRIETSLSAGYIHTSYDYYNCHICGEKLGHNTQRLLRPTKAAISIVFLIGSTEKRKTIFAPTDYADTTLIYQQTLDREREQLVLKQAIKQEVLEELKNQKKSSIDSSNHQCVGESLSNKYTFLVRTNKPEPGEVPDDTPRTSMMITFKQGSSDINPWLENNAQVLEELAAVLSSIQVSDDSRIIKIEVAGYASPEGLLYDNERIAARRATVLGQYLTSRLGIPLKKIAVKNGGEDWDGLRRLIEASNFQWKQQALDIIDQIPVKQGREKKLMDLERGDPYRYMYRHFFPQLRNAAYIKVYYEEIKQDY